MTTSVTDRLTMYTRRLDRLRQTLRDLGLDALMVTNPENRRYLTGYTGHDSQADSAGTLLVTSDSALLITDGRYLEQAARECPGLELRRREADLAPLVAAELHAANIARCGVEADHLRLAIYEDLGAALANEDSGPPLKLVSTRDVVERQRMIKDALEISAIERAVAITDQTFSYICGYLRTGLTERQIAREVERQMLELGAEGLAFDTIVASGPNSALPHAVPGDREIGPGEFITFDMGARYDGYCADMTRTVCLGAPGPEQQELYTLVLEAQERCLRGLHPGLDGKAADALARDYFREQGREEQYLHSTGHGLGLEIHEDPRLSKSGETFVLEPGMAVTVEPGLYIAGAYGVRIEDTVIVTDEGIRILTTSEKHLQLPL